MGWLSNLWRYGFTAQQRRTSRAAEQYAAALAVYARELEHVTPEEAGRQAERLLDAPGDLRVYPWAGEIRDLAALAPGQRTIFSRVRRVEACVGEPYIDAAELRPYEGDARLTCIGSDSEHAYLVVQPGQEPVYVVDETEALRLSEAQRFPTLAHWLLWLERSDELLQRGKRDEP